MNTIKTLTRICILALAAVVICFVFTGCEYEVPITSSPTGKVNEKLLGDWESKGKAGEKNGEDKMKVVRLDDSIYIVSYEGDLFRAYHSDVAKTPFVSIQELESTKRKYAYMTWKLSDDGQQLSLRVVNDEVVSKDTKDSAAVQKLLEKNLQNTNLFGEEVQFIKAK